MGYKTIGIRVLDDSNILDRLKVAAKKHDMSYAELINYWLMQDEAEPEPAQLSLFPAPAPIPEPQPAPIPAPIAPQKPAPEPESTARMLAIEETVNKLSQSLQAFMDKMTFPPVQILPEPEPECPKEPENEARILALEETVSKLSQSLQAFMEKLTPVPVENLPEAEQESPQKPSWKLRLMELHFAGLSTRQIAAKLTEEGYPTIRGRNTAWHPATVSKLIKAYSGEAPQEPATVEPAPKQTARRGRKPKS